MTYSPLLNRVRLVCASLEPPDDLHGNYGASRFMMGSLLRAFATAAVSEASAAVEPTPAQTDSGRVRGTVAAGVIAFKGIPFAQPPVGALRWRSPQPVKPWDGIRDAMAFSPNPRQPAPSEGSALSVLASAGFSEDPRN